VTNTTLAIITASMAVPRFNTFDMDSPFHTEWTMDVG
jgi:hypothetical protein